MWSLRAHLAQTMIQLNDNYLGIQAAATAADAEEIVATIGIDSGTCLSRNGASMGQLVDTKERERETFSSDIVHSVHQGRIDSKTRHL